jgi:hypothetical protein
MTADSQASSSATTPSNKILIYIIVGLSLVILGGLGYFFYKSQTAVSVPAGGFGRTDVTGTPTVTPTAATLAGQITWSNLKPDADDEGTIDILIRRAGTLDDFVRAARLAVQDTSWQYETAEAGVNYEIYGIVNFRGEVVGKTPVETVTAPALNIILDFHITWEDLGMESVNIPVAYRTIAGKVVINGYIPAGSKLTLTETVANKTSDLITMDVGSNQQEFQITEVDPTINYTFGAILKTGAGAVIGTSSQKIAAQANDSQVNFVINSTAIVPTPTPTPRATASPVITPPPTSSATPVPNLNLGKMEGRIVLNGPLDQNTRLLVLGKRPEVNDYQVWQAIENPNNDGQYWEYQEAVIGQDYDVQIALQVNGNNVSTSRRQTMRAPASRIDFTLNTNFFIPAPNDSQVPRAEPCFRDGNSWYTYVTMPKIDNVGQYWLQIGDRPGYSNYYNQKFIPTDPNQDVRLRINDLAGNKNLSLRYTYSVCRTCSSESNFAPWSKEVGFTCE